MWAEGEVLEGKKKDLNRVNWDFFQFILSNKRRD